MLFRLGGRRQGDALVLQMNTPGSVLAYVGMYQRRFGQGARGGGGVPPASGRAGGNAPYE